MLALVDSCKLKLEDWIFKNIEDIKPINFFKVAPFVKHSFTEIVFFYAWLIKFTSGWQDTLSTLNNFSSQVYSYIKSDSRFDERFLTLKYVHESIDKICFDLLWYESLFDVKIRQNLRNFYITCLRRHPNSGYFLDQLSCVEGSTSVVSSVWREVCNIVKDKTLVSYYLSETVARIALSNFVKVLDPDMPQNISPIGLGFLNKLHNLLEYLISLPKIKHSPLIWRLMLWTTSILSNETPSTEACEELKTVLYRAIQDVPWCKALYLDTALYLDKIGQLYTTTKKEIVIGDYAADHEVVEEEDVEPKFEEIPGTLEHITELMIEKDLRVRLPIQELDVLLEPV